MKWNDSYAIAVTLAIAAISLAAWTLLFNRRFGVVDGLSSLGLLVVAAIVGVGLLIDWLRDWRTFRALRQHLAKTRTERRHSDPRASKR